MNAKKANTSETAYATNDSPKTISHRELSKEAHNKSYNDIDQWEGNQHDDEPDQGINSSIFCSFEFFIITI
jgi:hypothetical protein